MFDDGLIVTAWLAWIVHASNCARHEYLVREYRIPTPCVSRLVACSLS